MPSGIDVTTGGEGGIRTHGRDALNQEVRKIYGFAVPCNPLASPDFAVDLAIAANSPFRPDPARHDRPLSGRPSVPWSVSSAAGGALLMAGAASIYKASLRISS